MFCMEFSWAFFWKAVKLKIVVSSQCCFSWCIMQIQSGAWFRFSYSSPLMQALCKVLALRFNEFFFSIWLLLTFSIRPSSFWFVIISQTCTSPVCWTLKSCPLLQGSLSLHSLSLLICSMNWRCVLVSRNFQVLCSQLGNLPKSHHFLSCDILQNRFQ